MKHFRIAHRLVRRLRVIAPPLIGEQERCYILEILLRKHAAIRDVRIVPEIGSLTVRYDPAVLPEQRLLATLDAILGNLLTAPPADTVEAAPVDGPVSECSLAVEGMTCASCALLIEMKLRRDPRVRSATVNFAAATLTVHGVMDRDTLSDIVRRLGYEARPMDTLSQRRLLVERENAQSLADALERVLTQPGLGERLAAQGRKDADTLYTLERMISRYEALFTQILAGQSTDFSRL